MHVLVIKVLLNKRSEFFMSKKTVRDIDLKGKKVIETENEE